MSEVCDHERCDTKGADTLQHYCTKRRHLHTDDQTHQCGGCDFTWPEAACSNCG